ncbi:hypothetical protein BT63DRAFT_451004 [Microthyrium microscopicum]|uniref:BRCT domain-containing protein n=1 Tax=Microthyrium microscopicum TaxID=703497 RepID=A0A6A6UNH2_9PEZI|nr:hypothetical protein BT63DRAFT_451004 [Microthyrium microscopicum]
MSTRPSKRARLAQSANVQQSENEESQDSSRVNQRQTRREKAHRAKSPSPQFLVETHAALMNKSFRQFADSSRGDTQLVETQDYNMNDEAGDSSLPLRGPDDENSLAHADSGDELENLVTDPPDLPQRKMPVVNPQTPVTSGKNESRLLTSDTRPSRSATKTPGSELKRMFGGFGAGVELTQAFATTQLGTSPANAPRSDPVFDRPSPDYHTQQRTPAKYFASTPAQPTFKNLDDTSQDFDEIEIRTPMPPAPVNRLSAHHLATLAKLPGPVAKEQLLKDDQARAAGVSRARSSAEPIVIEDDDESDAEPPITVTKPRIISARIPLSSTIDESVDAMNEDEGAQSHKQGNLKIAGTPEDVHLFFKVPRMSGTQHTDRVTDSQCTPHDLERPPIPSSPSGRPDTGPLESIYSHLASSQKAKLGTTTQAALNTSSPQRPPTLKDSGPESQSPVPSSPPVVREELPLTNGTSQKSSSYSQVRVLNLSQGQDEIEDDELRPPANIIDLGVNNFASQIASVDPHTQQEASHMLNEPLRLEDVGDSEIIEGEDNSISLIQDAPDTSNGTDYQTAESRIASAPNGSTSSPLSDLHTQRRKYLEISDDELDELSSEIPEKLILSGSSPVNWHGRKRQKISSPGRKDAQEDKEMVPLSTRSTEVVEQPNGSEQAGVEISSATVHQFATPAGSNVLGRGRLTRPKKFFNSTARDREKRQAAKSKMGSVFDVEESQYGLTSTGTLSASHPVTPFESSKQPEPEKGAFQSEVVTGEDMITDLSQENLVYTDRIFGYFPGQYNACYPGTCKKEVAIARGAVSLDVLWDDGSTSAVDANKWIFRLELRPGDFVKVELPRMRGKNYVVVGLKNKFNPLEAEPSVQVPTMDVFGYQTVCVTTKSRDSISSTVEVAQIIDIPVSKIKIAPQEFEKLESRKYIPSLNIPTASTVPTPLSTSSRSRVSTPVFDNSRRSVHASERAASPVQDVQEAIAEASGVFGNMSFALSNIPEEDAKAVKKALRTNGGSLVEHGFEELFDLPTTLFADSTASSSTQTRPQLHLSAVAQNIGFTAVLADQHSRRAKHMQALALAIPVLHYRWAIDSAAQGRPLPWARYALAAGESKSLQGAILSRTLVPYAPDSPEAQLARTLSRRDQLFSGERILFVSAGKRLPKKRKVFMFLTVALGVKAIQRVADLEEAYRVYREATEDWDWIYVDSEEQMKEAKVKFEADNCWLVDDDFVLQSLISGALED